MSRIEMQDRRVVVSIASTMLTKSGKYSIDHSRNKNSNKDTTAMRTSSFQYHIHQVLTPFAVVRYNCIRAMP